MEYAAESEIMCHYSFLDLVSSNFVKVSFRSIQNHTPLTLILLVYDDGSHNPA